MECEDDDQNRPIHYACMQNSMEKIALLIEAGVSLYTKNYEGSLPLDICLESGNINIVMFVFTKYIEQIYKAPNAVAKYNQIVVGRIGYMENNNVMSSRDKITVARKMLEAPNIMINMRRRENIDDGNDDNDGNDGDDEVEALFELNILFE